MNQQDNKIHFRKTLYFKMSLLILFLGVVFFGALLSVYGMSRVWFEDELAYHSDTLTEQVCRNVEVTLKELSEETALRWAGKRKRRLPSFAPGSSTTWMNC